MPVASVHDLSARCCERPQGPRRRNAERDDPEPACSRPPAVVLAGRLYCAGHAPERIAWLDDDSVQRSLDAAAAHTDSPDPVIAARAADTVAHCRHTLTGRAANRHAAPGDALDLSPGDLPRRGPRTPVYGAIVTVETVERLPCGCDRGTFAFPGDPDGPPGVVVAHPVRGCHVIAPGEVAVAYETARSIAAARAPHAA